MLRQIVSQARKPPSLIPLFVFIGAGGSRAVLYVMHLALFHPDVCWDKKRNPEHWKKLGAHEQYKILLNECRLQRTEERRNDFLMECFTINLLRMKVPAAIRTIFHLTRKSLPSR